MQIEYHAIIIYYTMVMFINYFLELFCYFRKRGKEGERKGEKYRCERETSISCLLYAPQPGTEPAAWELALTGNRTGYLLLCRRMPYQLSHISL